MWSHALCCEMQKAQRLCFPPLGFFFKCSGCVMGEALAVWHLVIVAAGLAVSIGGLMFAMYAGYSRAIDNLHKKISGVSRDLAAHEKEVAQKYVGHEQLSQHLTNMEAHIGHRIDGVHASINNLIEVIKRG